MFSILTNPSLHRVFYESLMQCIHVAIKAQKLSVLSIFSVKKDKTEDAAATLGLAIIMGLLLCRSSFFGIRCNELLPS